MALSTRTIKRRLKSIRNTKKITKAMELVAAAKMRKAVSAAVGGRRYATLSWEMLVNLSKIIGESRHPLLEVRPVKKILLLVITSNRGLAGGLNANILRAVVARLKNPAELGRNRSGAKWLEPAVVAPQIDILSIGKKGESALGRLGHKIIAAFHTLSDTPAIIDALPISRICLDEYAKKNYDKIVIAYTDFVSAINQKPKLRQILPISTIDLQKMLAGAGGEAAAGDVRPASGAYHFEPDAATVLAMMVDRLVSTQIYQALLEAAASEHSSRMMAMRNATDAATDMIDDLTFTFNQARQAGITREISEISAGASALE